MGKVRSTELEAELTALKGRGDQHGYFKLIMEAELYVPMVEGGRPAIGTYNHGTYVLAFTSPESMEEARGGPVGDYRRATFAELARGWPRPDWQLAINARLPSAAFIDAGTIRRIAQRPRERKPTPPPSVVMQKAVRPEQVAHYVEGGYDWVAGHVHRAADVRGLRTPAELVQALGLDYGDSPFTVHDTEIHVIRWQLVKGSPARVSSYGGDPAIPEFRIDSQRLPHGAELLRLDHAGVETPIASYDADVRRWIRR